MQGGGGGEDNEEEEKGEEDEEEEEEKKEGRNWRRVKERIRTTAMYQYFWYKQGHEGVK